MAEAALLRITAPAARMPERRWVLDEILRRRLGLSFDLVEHVGDELRIRAPHGVLSWPERFFTEADLRWRTERSLPAVPWPRWRLPDSALAQRIGTPDVAIPFGDDRFEAAAGRTRLPLDLAGSAFFMLSRYEEAVAGAPRDRHGRFPGLQAQAYRGGLHERPLVDEWVELLWWALAPLLPDSVQRPRGESRTWVTCDVDLPYAPARASLRRGLRHAASLVVNERRFATAASTLAAGLALRAGAGGRDPLDRFDEVMQAGESLGQRVTFFFIAQSEATDIDGGYTLAEPRLFELLHRIASRGHAFGLHGSYASVDAAKALRAELDTLREAVERAGGRVEPVSARQHYLRWYAADDGKRVATARRLAEAGVAVDSTLGFADAPGFRCGTAHPFALFDLDRREPLPVMEHPLLLMDASLLSRHYAALPAGLVALERALALRRACERFGGEFTLLWHNDALTDAAQREMYAALLAPSAPA